MSKLETPQVHLSSDDISQALQPPGLCAPYSPPQGPTQIKILKDLCDGADPSTGATPIQTDFQSTHVIDASGLLELDSFLPIVNMLPSILHRNEAEASPAHPYRFEGIPSDHDAKELERFVTSIEGFTLSKASLESVSFSMLLRLSRTQTWPGPFFPALKTLRILDCDDETLQVLDLFLTPSLDTIEVTVGHRWDDGSDDTLDSFLATIAVMSPKLARFKHSPLDSTSWENYGPLEPDYCPFKYLRSLHLEHISVWEWQSMEALTELASLEALRLTTVLTHKYKGRAPTSTDGAEWNILMDCAPDNSPGSQEFQNLKILHVVGHVEFLRDFLGSIGSSKVQQLSIKLLTAAGEPESLEDIKRKLTQQTNSKKAGRLSDEDAVSAIRTSRRSFTFRNEDQFFCYLIDKCITKWTQLTAVDIDHEQVTEVPRHHFMSLATVRKILALASLERFEISEWIIDFDLGKIIDDVCGSSKSNLKILHLPDTATSYSYTQGLGWDILAKLSKALPKLESFRGYLKRGISAIPDYTAQSPPVPKPLSNFNLSTLALGDGTILWDSNNDPNYLPRVGLYIFGLFPNLKEIRATEGADESLEGVSNWDQIKQLVRMFQTSTRLIDHSKQ